MEKDFWFMDNRIQVKRVYDDPDGTELADGFRVYVDRLWPRGESKVKFHYDLWAKDVAPSNELRRWFHQDAETRWPEFCERYRTELRTNPAFKIFVQELKPYSKITLLYSSSDRVRNNAIVLASVLSDAL